jgi:molybdopterin biosynthesis enzyme MoaB
VALLWGPEIGAHEHCHVDVCLPCKVEIVEEDRERVEQKTSKRVDVEKVDDVLVTGEEATCRS